MRMFWSTRHLLEKKLNLKATVSELYFFLHLQGCY